MGEIGGTPLGCDLVHSWDQAQAGASVRRLFVDDDEHCFLKNLIFLQLCDRKAQRRALI